MKSTGFAKLSPRSDFIFGVAGIATLVVIWCVLTYGGCVGRHVSAHANRYLLEELADFNDRHCSSGFHPPELSPRNALAGQQAIADRRSDRRRTDGHLTLR